jgi:hypothetical protein
MGSLGRLPLRIALIDEMAMQTRVMRAVLVLSLAMVTGMGVALIMAARLPEMTIAIGLGVSRFVSAGLSVGLLMAARPALTLTLAAWLPVSLAVVLAMSRSAVTRIIQQNHNPFFISLWCRQT